MISLFTVNMPPREVLMPKLEETLYSGYIGQGPRVDEFEAKFAKRIYNKNVLALNGGTSALHLALRLANVGGGEVITTPMTCTATNMPILANGAKIVWADIDPHSGNIDPQDVERKITTKTKAIMIVHWGGQPCDMVGFNYLEKKYGIPVIEDAAHAMGAAGIGTSAFTCYSLQAIKHITTIDGGILVTRDTDTYKRGKLLRWYGIDREGDRKDFRCEEDIQEWGYKFHMNDVTATIGLVQLNYLDKIVGRHRDIVWNHYIPKIKWDSGFYRARSDTNSSNWLFTVLLPRHDRDSFMNHMKINKIMTSRVHERNDKHTAFREFERNLPGVDAFCSRMLCLPMHSKLTDEEVQKVIDVTNQYWLKYQVGP